jgi:Protein of unknown function (DUF2961)
MKSTGIPDGEKPQTLARRNLLTLLASTGAVFGFRAPAAAGAVEQAKAAGSVARPPGLGDLARLRDYKNRRSSSYDKTGGNADYAVIAPGQTVTLLDAAGPGIVTHIWFTINSDEEYHLKKLVLRAYWDGEREPSVEVPVGDFFGLALGEYFLYQSALTAVASVKALNAYFPMPFAKSAKISVANEGNKPTDNFYYNIDYASVRELPSDLAYFHAEYRQAAPCRGWTDEWTRNYEPLLDSKKNLDGQGNYVFLEAQGYGHFVGVTHGILQNQDGWPGEGDEMIFVDGQTTPEITGTGSEDYYNGAWNFGGVDAGRPFSYLHNGAPFISNQERVGGRYCLYRWHLESPVAFQKSIRVTIEHGHANHRSDNFYTTAFWYQTEPHAPLPPLPRAEARVPRVVQMGGPGALPRPADK